MPMTAPLADRLRSAAETIEMLNARDGLGVNASVSPMYLRREAARLDGEAIA